MLFAPPIAKVVTPAVLAIVPTVFQGSDVILREGFQSINDIGVMMSNDRDTVKSTMEEAIRAERGFI